MIPSNGKSERETTRVGWGLLIAAAAVAVAVFVAYWPCLDAAFVDWDDDKNILENPSFRGLRPHNLRWMFTTTYMGPYQPLSWLTLGIDHAVWGLNPRGYHLTNNLLHAAGAAMMCLVTASILMAWRLRTVRDDDNDRAGEDQPSAGPSAGVILAAVVAALAWALHPQHVESVAWVTERRDVLSGLFYLASVWTYLLARRPGLDDGARRWWMVVSVVCCALGLGSKAIVVSVPVVLLVLDVYPLRRLRGRPWGWLRRSYRRVLIEKLPYTVLAALAVVAGFIGQARSGALRSLDQVGLIDRLAIAAHAMVFYIGKTIWPAGLSPLYPRPETIRLTEPRFLYALIAVVAVSAVLLLLRRRWPAGLAVWVCYGAVLLPVSGLITIGDELVADRYSYLPTSGLFVLLGGVFVTFWQVEWSGAIRSVWRVAVTVVAVIIVVVCGWQARRGMAVWHDSLALWTRATERRPESHKAWNNLGAVLTKAGRYAEAEDACRKAVERREDYDTGYCNLGIALTRLGRHPEAAEAYGKAIQIDPANARAHNYLGIVLIWLDRPADAVEHLNEALALDLKRVPNARFHLGEAYRKLGRHEDAAGCYEAVIKTHPKKVLAHAGLADVYLSLGRVSDAKAAAFRAVALMPGRPESRYAMAQVLSRQSRVTEALDKLRRALANHQPSRDRALTDPHLDAVRLDPRFKRMMRRLPAIKSPTHGSRRQVDP